MGRGGQNHVLVMFREQGNILPGPIALAYNLSLLSHLIIPTHFHTDYEASAMTFIRLLTLCVLLVSALIPVTTTAATHNAQELASLRNAATDHDPGAQLLLGLAYLEGRYGLKPDGVRATHWLRRAAREDQPYAQLLMGTLHAQGRYLSKDLARAVYWWHRAAVNGNIEAKRHLGMAYLQGRGVKKDAHQAIHWLRRAAEAGDQEARFQLGRMYYEGYGVPSNKARARDWLGQAAAQGYSPAIELLDLFDKLGRSTTEVYHETADALIARAKHGDAEAEYELGLRYESGVWDVLKNNHQALVWLKRAANHGNRHAMKALAHIYQVGKLGVKADPAQAKAWQTRATAAPGNNTAK